MLATLIHTGGCASPLTHIYVQTPPDVGTEAELDDGPYRGSEFCHHGFPLSQDGIALRNGCDIEAVPQRLTDAETVGLTTLGPVIRPRSARPGTYFLGAGDSLGQTIFGSYAMMVRAEGRHPLPGTDPKTPNATANAMVQGETRD